MSSSLGFSKYFHTLRHIPTAQLGHLVLHRIRGFYRRRFPSQTARTIAGKAEKEYPLNSVRHHKKAGLSWGTREPREAYEIFQHGTVRILNRDHSFDRNDFWGLADSDSLSPLDLETLHYHSFLLDWSSLLVDWSPSHDKADVLETTEQVLNDWCRRFPPGIGPAWDPFTVAFRSQNWMRIHSYLVAVGEEAVALREILERFLFEHGLYLERNLEKHLGGNHLIKDLCGLAMLSGFFKGPTADRWFRIVEKELPPQLEIQVLPDGGHYERSPMYHVLVFVDLVDAVKWLNLRVRDWVEKKLRPVLDRMADFLRGITHGDGEIPFFNDSVLGQAIFPNAALDRYLDFENVASWPESFEVFPESGFSRMVRGDITMLFDHGRLGPDELMGHVHNDALSFEVSVGAERFIVNRGVYEYKAGSKRDECRSIRSHNTPCVDGLEQSEIWGSFRVARRWHPDAAEIGEEDGVWRVKGSWSRPGMPRIVRIFRSFPGGVFSIEDEFQGSGTHSVEIPIHFASGVEVKIQEEEPGRCWSWEACTGNNRLYGLVRSSKVGSLTIEPSTWWPRFYVEEDTLRLTYSAEGEIPLSVSTAISADPAGLNALREQSV